MTTARVSRVDYLGELAPPLRTTEGVLFTGYAARSGAHRYFDKVEHRSRAELERLVEALPGTPIVLDHPADGMLRDGSRAPIVGKVLSARSEFAANEHHARVSMLITDDAAARAIERGTRELSLGYRTEIVTDADGLHWHTESDLDHLAIVRTARCGSSCAIKVDCATTCSCKEPMYTDNDTDDFDIIDDSVFVDDVEVALRAGDAARDVFLARMDDLWRQPPERPRQDDDSAAPRTTYYDDDGVAARRAFLARQDNAWKGGAR